MISVAIMHKPGSGRAREESLEVMLAQLDLVAHHFRRSWCVFDDYADRPWQEFKTVIALRQWEWAASTGCDHHLFMTDDLNLCPRFPEALGALLSVAPRECIGLLSNHPRATSLAADGRRWYRCNSWIVGPAYVLPHADLVEFIAWRKALPLGDREGCADWYNDDSSINEWITRTGRSSLHPLPTLIEHRADMASLVGHGDRFSRERVSWRAMRTTEAVGDGFRWVSEEVAYDPARLASPDFWLAHGGPSEAPMLKVGG